MNAKRRPPDFEKSLAELEGLVEKLERGDQALEESLRLFERGVQLTRECQTALTEAQARVNILTQTPGGPELAPFDAADDENP
jgi:exodeoxyribonuclease VII small subunit